jgi:hypothetical protein
VRRFRSRRKWSAAIIGVAALGVFAAVALGSMGVGFSPTNLVTGNLVKILNVNSDGVTFKTDTATDVRVQKIVFAPGGFSGWHHHPGIVIATVASGEVKFTKGPDCSSTVYGQGRATGSVFVDSGDDPGQASSIGGATVYATFVAPHANPPVFRIEDNPPPCATR